MLFTCVWHSSAAELAYFILVYDIPVHRSWHVVFLCMTFQCSGAGMLFTCV